MYGGYDISELDPDDLPVRPPRLTAESRLLLLAHQAKLRDDILPREEELGELVSPLPELCFGRAAGQHARLGADIKYRAAPVRQGIRLGRAQQRRERSSDPHHVDRGSPDGLVAHAPDEAASRAQVDAGIAVRDGEDGDGDD